MRLVHGVAGTAAVAMLFLTAGAAPAAPTVKMSYVAVNGYVNGYVAKDQGFFAKRGVDLDFILTQASPNIPAAIVSGSTDIGGPTMATLLQANDAGLDLVVIAGGGVYPLDGDILVARPDAGIRTANDLKGKVVGVPGIGSLLHVMLRRHLKANGVDPDSVRYIEIGFPQAADALKTGRIDAYPSQSPFTARILQSGVGVPVANFLADTPDGTLTVIFATSRKWANDHRDTVKALRDGLREADVFIKTHKDAANESIAKYTKLPLAVVETIAVPNSTADVTPDQVKFWVDIAREQQLIKGNPDPKSLLFEP